MVVLPPADVHFSSGCPEWNFRDLLDDELQVCGQHHHGRVMVNIRETSNPTVFEAFVWLTPALARFVAGALVAAAEHVENNAREMR
ncbi:hypothetical protein [Allokutzneria oryzae]|uniref:Uncharacterized protein n=1 Tax=Allokutzneria oryzae TaxID=1378989 RepID=A0ABV6ACN3_9PSEU